MSDDHGFETFWAAYPRRDAKKDAQRAWNQIGPPDGPLLATILGDLQTRVWPRERKYIPLPATYLRGERWNDEAKGGAKMTPERWQDITATYGERIQDGSGAWCVHQPTCETQLDCLRRTLREQRLDMSSSVEVL